jgi:5-methyltetrahydrofolate--homocysteine methyltransferase
MIDEGVQRDSTSAGYPACPDHLEKPTIWKLLNVEERN